jgi:glucose-1-phosphatase
VTELRAVCFDLGGVLVEIAHTWEEALDAADIPHSLPGGTPLVAAPLFVEYQAGEVNEAEYLRALAGYLGLAEVGNALTAHDAILLREGPWVLEAVRRLNASGIVTGCLSNTNALHWAELNRPERFPGLAELQVRLASHEIGANKPDEAAYRAFEAAVGFHGREIAFFDDHPGNVAAARELGWQAEAACATGTFPAVQARIGASVNLAHEPN